jgi:hypothetical protein
VFDSNSNDPIRRWRTADLAALVPGTNEFAWRTELAPQLVSAGALHRRGRAWYGRRGEIEAAIMGRFSTPSIEASSPDVEPDAAAAYPGRSGSPGDRAPNRTRGDQPGGSLLTTPQEGVTR